ncbi:MAG: hypothetical protein IPL46_05505 [Saprospiraceae bacterium]|nr:hypothetical protein [Saprospiraceae bacterium]
MKIPSFGWALGPVIIGLVIFILWKNESTLSTNDEIEALFVYEIEPLLENQMYVMSWQRTR